MNRVEARLHAIDLPSNEQGESKVAGAASARKLLNVIFQFSPERPHWTVPELSATLNMSLSSMYRYVALLREVGVVEAYGENSYRLSERVVGLARAAQQGRTLLETTALPVLTQIRDNINETALIARRHGDHAYCVERVESRQAVRLQFDRGQPMSLHLGSLARVLLAHAPEEDRRRYLASITGSLTKKMARQLSPAALAAVAEAGYTESSEEIDEGIWGTAAAVRSEDGVIAALGVAAPIFRTDKAKRDHIVAEVRAGADKISRCLGTKL